MATDMGPIVANASSNFASSSDMKMQGLKVVCRRSDPFNCKAAQQCNYLAEKSTLIKFSDRNVLSDSLLGKSTKPLIVAPRPLIR